MRLKQNLKMKALSKTTVQMRQSVTSKEIVMIVMTAVMNVMKLISL